MEKINADRLAVKMVAKILDVRPEIATGTTRGGTSAAIGVADFIKNLSIRLQEDIDHQVFDDILDKNQ